MTFFQVLASVTSGVYCLPLMSRQWRFNSTLLSNAELTKLFYIIFNVFIKTNTNPDVSYLTLWDMWQGWDGVGVVWLVVFVFLVSSFLTFIFLFMY